jgi:hypothetical protein
MAFCGGGTEEQSTSFSRKGTTGTSERRNVPDFLSSLMERSAETAGPHSASTGASYGFLYDLLASPASESVVDAGVLNDLIALPGSDYAGKTSLHSIASQDPYSDEFASGFEDFFRSAFEEAAAAGATGPDAVRGGANRGEFFKADMMEKAALNKTRELTNLAQRQAEISTGAASAANTIESGQRAVAAGAQGQKVGQIQQGQAQQLSASDLITKNRVANAETLAAFANILAGKAGVAEEDLSGQGSQAGSSFNWGAGVNCCFIFAEALNGPLPWYVRRGRDLMCTPQRKLGYARMAARLVPAMRRSRVVRWLVNLTMIKPFLACGKWFFTGHGRGWLVRPVCEMWFRVWDFVGKDVYGND